MGTRRKGGRNKDFVKKPPPLPNPKYEPLEQSLKQKGFVYEMILLNHSLISMLRKQSALLCYLIYCFADI